MENLHLGAKWLFRIKGYFGALFFLIFMSWFFVPVISIVGVIFSGDKMGAEYTVPNLIGIAISIFVIYIIAIIVIAEIYARMTYNRWKFEFTPSNLKLERGIIWKRYSNLPYERVQNVDITRGILARMLGFSTVNIQTAGYGFSGRGMPSSEGYIPAVSIKRAEEIRDFLMKKISKRGRNQGL